MVPALWVLYICRIQSRHTFFNLLNIKHHHFWVLICTHFILNNYLKYLNVIMNLKNMVCLSPHGSMYPHPIFDLIWLKS